MPGGKQRQRSDITHTSNQSLASTTRHPIPSHLAPKPRREEGSGSPARNQEKLNFYHSAHNRPGAKQSASHTGTPEPQITNYSTGTQGTHRIKGDRNLTRRTTQRCLRHQVAQHTRVTSVLYATTLALDLISSSLAHRPDRRPTKKKPSKILQSSLRRSISKAVDVPSTNELGAACLVLHERMRFRGAQQHEYPKLACMLVHTRVHSIPAQEMPACLE